MVAASTYVAVTTLSSSSAISSALGSAAYSAPTSGLGVTGDGFQFSNGNLEILGNRNPVTPNDIGLRALPPEVSSLGAPPLSTPTAQLPSSIAQFANPMQAAAAS